MKRLLVVSCALILVCAAFVTLRAGAQSTVVVTSPQLASAQFLTFGMVGLGTGQTARLNALALPTGGPIIAGGSCQVTFDFYDAAGKVLKTGTLPVTQGAAVSFDLARTEIVNATTDRPEIRGALRAAFSSPSASPFAPVAAFCSILPTMEIFDSNGQTTVALEQTRALPLVTPL
jgi:hypothetical protein